MYLPVLTKLYYLPIIWLSILAINTFDAIFVKIKGYHTKKHKLHNI